MRKRAASRRKERVTITVSPDSVAFVKRLSRQVIRDWAGHGSDKLVDLYTNKMWQYRSPETAGQAVIGLKFKERRVASYSKIKVYLAVPRWLNGRAFGC